MIQALAEEDNLPNDEMMEEVSIEWERISQAESDYI